MFLSLAPMADITHLAFRRLVSHFKAPSLFYSEMIHSPSLLSGGHFEKWYIKTYSNEKLIWQITSNETETVKETIPILLNNGGLGIDLNMGCSAPHIVATGAGFAWLKKDRNCVGRFVKNARYALDEYIKHSGKKELFLSVKMRLISEEYSILKDFVLFLIDSGVEKITLHPRFQKQRYSRMPHYEYIENLAKDVLVNVFGNGDVKSYLDIKHLSLKYPHVSGWMIGREAIKKPWIFKEIENEAMNVPKKTKIDLLEVALLFLQNLKEDQPKEFHLLRAKRFFSYFCDNFTFSHYVKTKILNAKCIEEMLDILKSYFSEMPNEKERFI